MTFNSVGHWACQAVCLMLALSLAGCGASGTKYKAPVKGKVVANGQPVTGGSLTFAPADSSMVATSASGAIQPDGTFVLMTDKPGDGAAIGKHTISFSPPFVEQPEWDGYGQKPAQKEVPYVGMVPKEVQVEVKSGQNDVSIELVPAGAGGS